MHEDEASDVEEAKEEEADIHVNRNEFGSGTTVGDYRNHSPPRPPPVAHPLVAQPQPPLALASQATEERMQWETERRILLTRIRELEGRDRAEYV